jgi:PAS domain-containing protein
MRKRSQRAKGEGSKGMAADRHFYERLLKGIPDGVYFMDRDRIIRYWNHGAEKITGFKKHEVTSRPEEAKEIINGLMDRKDKYFLQYDKVIADFELTMASKRPHLKVEYLKHRNCGTQGY